MNSFNILQGAIDMLLKFYKEHLPRMTDYLTHNGQIIWTQVEVILEEVLGGGGASL